eukprot:TRINITY_DN10295_c0_g1_i1.p1 TRINITY_DN10295_c0_g1~~TRINITY_DN10295_c0_g1_i1.p1  ORF type:complete len:454 (+),score=69.69 TRINITY_DN10295_c0_g1_i1:114-1364(+)
MEAAVWCGPWRVVLPDEATAALAGRVDAKDGSNLQHLLCGQCAKPAYGIPVEVAACQHMFHRDCLWLDQPGAWRTQCPKCHIPVNLPGDLRTPGLAVRRTLAEAKVCCPLQCGAAVSFECLGKHLRDDCPNTPMACEIVGCKEVCKRSERGTHSDDCPHREMSCQNCRARLQQKEIQVHLAQHCPFRLVDCTVCGNMVEAKALYTEHLASCSGTTRWMVALRDEIKQNNEELAEILAEAPRIRQFFAEISETNVKARSEFVNPDEALRPGKLVCLGLVDKHAKTSAIQRPQRHTFLRMQGMWARDALQIRDKYPTVGVAPVLYMSANGKVGDITMLCLVPQLCNGFPQWRREISGSCVRVYRTTDQHWAAADQRGLIFRTRNHARKRSPVKGELWEDQAGKRRPEMSVCGDATPVL